METTKIREVWIFVLYLKKCNWLCNSVDLVQFLRKVDVNRVPYIRVSMKPSQNLEVGEKDF